jgi:hypothetical protein
MKSFLLILYLIFIFFFAYGCGIVSAWLCEWRRNTVYKKMRHEIILLEDVQMSGAVLRIKTYKIMEDYRRRALGIEKVQQFILEKWLFVKKSSLKNPSPHRNVAKACIAR